MSRKFRVNASRKPVKCKMSDEEFYTRDFPSVAAGKVVVKPQRGNWTVFIGLSDGTIAYQWCESKEKAQREAKYARDTIKRYGADDSYWVEEGYKIWNPNVESKKKVSCKTSPKNKRTVKAARNPKIEDWGDGPVKVFWKSGKWSIIMDGYGLGITDGWGVERPIIYTHKNPPTVAYEGTAVSVPPYVKRKFEELVQKGVLKNRSDLYDSGEWDTYFEASASPKRKRTINAAASKNDLTRKLSKLYNDYMAIDDDKALKKTGMTLAEYNALPDVFERLQKNGHVNTFMTGLANYFKKFGFSVSLGGTDYEITASSSTKRKRTIVRANASAGNEEIIKELTDWGFDAESDGSALYDMFLDDGYVATVNTSSGEAYISNPDGSEYYRTMILNVNDAVDFISIARELDEELGYIGGSDLSAEDLGIDSAQSIECGDAIADRFMVDLMYQANGGYAEDRYFDDWSEVEAYAHDGLMRGFYARIWDKQTGDTITISPDEYAEAWENGAADFDINEDIVNFKNRVVTSSTKIQCDGGSDGTYCIVYNGKVIAETDGLYNGLDDCGESEIAEILLMDDAALKACADYVNSFGDPVLTGDEVGDANEVAMVLAEIISDDYAEYKSDTESFGDSISWDGNILEWFDSSDLADDVTSSTKIEAFRDDTVDETAVRELVLVITNDGDLYRQRTTPIIENLKKKAAKGTYDREKAVKLWQYLADDGVRMYDKEYGSGRGSVAMLNPATRRRIAEELRDYYEEEIMWDINHTDDDSELTTM